MSEPNKILLFLLAGAGVFAALHILIGVAKRELVQRYVTSAEAGGSAVPSVKLLIIDWAAKGLRLLVWLLYLGLVSGVLPQASEDVKDFWRRLAGVQDAIVKWLSHQGIKVLIAVGITIFLMRFASALIKTIFKLFERRAEATDEVAARRRLQTLSAIFRGTVQTIISFIGLMFVLKSLTVDITPILASAGVIGIAVGFGAQSLIKDLFAGLLILLEDQYSVGDTVKIGEASGTVEHLTLRATRIRGLDGALTSIPNGSISIVSNMSKDWSRVVLDVEVSTEEDIDRTMKLMVEEAQQMKKEMPRDILEEPMMLGVDKLSSTSVTLRLMLKTTPTKHFEIGRELRRRIKFAFERAGIKAPMPQQQLILANPPEVARADSSS
ncbi:MAG: mechanosensitive ion channel [Blastocatellia bacterium]|nr:mechanosensitive ion channel [Blastocatellia bacterium]